MSVAEWVAPGRIRAREGRRQDPGVGDFFVGVGPSQVPWPDTNLAHTGELASSVGVNPAVRRGPLRANATARDEMVEMAAFDESRHVAVQIVHVTNGGRTHALDPDVPMAGPARGRAATDGAAASGTLVAQAIGRMAPALGVQTELDLGAVCPSLALAKAIVACFGAIYVVGTGMVSFLTFADAPAMEKPGWRVTFFWSHAPDDWNFLERLGLVHRDRLEGVGAKRLQRQATRDGQSIRIETSGGQVTPSGHASSWESIENASDAAWTAPGVTQVVDEVTVSWRT